MAPRTSRAETGTDARVDEISCQHFVVVGRGRLESGATVRFGPIPARITATPASESFRPCLIKQLIILQVNQGGGIPQAEVLKSMGRFAKEVMPQFADPGRSLV